ncbi:MAG: hypothetical protein QXG36_03095 [Nitrososphaeria archaeon]
MIAKFFKMILFSLIILLTFVTVMVFLNILLNFIGDSLCRIYFAASILLLYLCFLFYVTGVFLKIRVFNSFYRLFKRSLKYSLPIFLSYSLPYILLKDNVIPLISHFLTISLYVIPKTKLMSYKTYPSTYKFCDGFLVEGFLIKRVHLIVQVYPSASQHTVVSRLCNFGEIFLLKYPLGSILLFKRSGLCVLYLFWKRFLKKRFLAPFKNTDPSLCYFRVLSCRELKEILGRNYVPAEHFSHLKGYSLPDLIYFPRSWKPLKYSVFMVAVRGSNILSLEKVGAKFFEVDHLPEYKLYLDENYAFLKSLCNYSRLIEYYGPDPVKANVSSEGGGFRVRILSSPAIFLEPGQLDLQLKLYSLNISMLQKG